MKVGNQEWRTSDCHFRSQDGFGSFNWRLKTMLTLPLTESESMMTLQAWDKDLIGRNELIGEKQLDF